MRRKVRTFVIFYHFLIPWLVAAFCHAGKQINEEFPFFEKLGCKICRSVYENKDVTASDQKEKHCGKSGKTNQDAIYH